MSEARSRLLATATRLFYAEGLHSVGVDRIVAEAKVTRATLYRHFAGKEDLVVAYLESVHEMERGAMGAVLSDGRPADDTLRAIAGSIAESIRSAHFRGCAFLNAAAEYPHSDDPVHRAVIAHRDWFLRVITGLFAQLGGMPAEQASRHFVMLRDGAMASGCLSDPAEVGETFLRGVEGLLRSASTKENVRS
ncbi:TetR/AcrR family transcriptional regulator [Amycolatopsis acidicola]|uniref:TetR/AcrR family transcriptional regulator n=1 Tax=Amycolatopsis acidicola TaxID=2596893 RepID=A0A5N0UXV8_9PSEU|nr:TetR/AcrR family transcriptional regulator [Amycolatopsis acidicola]KAA9156045.1 TetR/AcrR family transcriptional regulator [Amycolatopsis acidicola]